MNKHDLSTPSAHIALQLDLTSLPKAREDFCAELGEAETKTLFSEMAKHSLDMMRYASVVPLDNTGEDRTLSTSYELFIRGMSLEAAQEEFGVAVSGQIAGSYAARAREIFRTSFERGNTVVALVQANAPSLSGAFLNDALRKVALAGKGGLAFYCKSHMPVLLVLHKSAESFLDELIVETELGLEYDFSLAELYDLAIASIEGVPCVEHPAELELWDQVKRQWTKRASKISVIIPTHNEADNLALCITQARSYLNAASPGAEVEIVVVDGGSTDNTLLTASSHNAIVLNSDLGRAVQMNAGAKAASGDVLIFLHADTLLRAGSRPKDVRNILKEPLTIMGAFTFDFGLHGVKNKNAIGFSKLISSQVFEFTKRISTRKGALPFGDQAYFIRSEVFHALGGFPNYSLMEDYAFAKRCSLLGEISLSSDRAETSLRRSFRYDLFKAIRVNDSLSELFDEGASIRELERFRRRKLTGA